VSRSIGAAPSNYTAVDVDTQYLWRTTVHDDNSLTDIDSVTIYVYKTGATKGSFDEQRSYGFRWLRVGDVWQELTGAGWGTSYTYLNAAGSSHDTVSKTVKEGEWRFAAKLSKLAHYTSTNTDWNYEANVRDRAGGSGSRTGLLDVNVYISIVIVSAIDFGAVAAGVANQSALSMPAYTTYTANAIVKIQIRGGGDPTNEYGDTFPLSNIYDGQTTPASNNDGKKLTTSAQDWKTGLGVALDSQQPMYWFVTTPDPFPAGSYTFTYYINVDLQTWAT